MNGQNLNQTEWSKPDNWSTGIYRSRLDSRMIVPKRRGFGVTLNFGNRNAVILFFALLAVPLVIFLALYFSGIHLGRH